jgi:hypothetical protein
LSNSSHGFLSRDVTVFAYRPVPSRNDNRAANLSGMPGSSSVQ